MSEFGCFHDSIHNKCIKNIHSTSIEKECQIIENKCQIKSTIYVPTKFTATRLSEKRLVTNATLSGPYKAFSGMYKNNKILLFADAHFSLSNECKQPCKYISLPELDIISPPGSETCWEISRLLSDIFNLQNQEGNWVDFFLEIPFAGKNEPKSTAQNVYRAIRSSGNLSKLRYTFYNCFTKHNCQYSNVRFHYSDVRLQDKIVRNMPITLSSYISKRFEISLRIFTSRFNEFDNDIYDRNDFVEDTDKIIKSVYSVGQDEPLNKKLFKLYLTSDNYPTDLQKLLMSLIESLKESETKKELTKQVMTPLLTVNKNGKIMHRARAQLVALEQEGKSDISNLIQDFIISNYNTKTNNSTMIKSWNSFIKIYRSFIRGEVKRDDLTKARQKYLEFKHSNIFIDALLMDTYILSRMFRTFPGTNHIDSKVKIIYAGGNHIDTYVKFFVSKLGIKFDSYGKNIPKSVINPNRCIDININKFL